MVGSLLPTFLPSILQIGKLQLLRKHITSELHFFAKVESYQYTGCLENLNYTFLHNLEEIKETAKMTYVAREDENLLFAGGNDTFNTTKALTP